jgi:hypothetical protein
VKAASNVCARALVADMVAHGEEERVRFIIATTQAEQEGPENTVSNQLRDSVRYVSGSDLSKGNVKSLLMGWTFDGHTLMPPCLQGTKASSMAPGPSLPLVGVQVGVRSELLRGR